MIENFDSKKSWAFLKDNSAAVMIDVRTAIEHSFVGHPPESVHIAWKEFPMMHENKCFVDQVAETVSNKNVPILLLCRSGQRSLAAAKRLEKAGYKHLINIEQGFEGALDTENHRGNIGGWKFHHLPWEQS